MSGDYGFYVACLRFMERRTEAVTPEIVAMMRDIAEIADGVETAGEIVARFERSRPAARAMAGVAGFLQRHILPEAVALGDAASERRIRWMIDASMEAMTALTLHAETATQGTECRVSLPPPPVA